LAFTILIETGGGLSEEETKRLSSAIILHWSEFAVESNMAGRNTPDHKSMMPVGYGWRVTW